MKTETHIILLLDRQEGERLENTSYTSLDELKGVLANDGIKYLEITPLTDFMDEWNDSDADSMGLKTSLDTSFLTYINIIN